MKYIPAKEEFVTAYTPYQAEMSQGLLQSIFEYQTMICQLTGMDVSNASVYDGATAAAEAVAMCRDRKRPGDADLRRGPPRRHQYRPHLLLRLRATSCGWCPSRTARTDLDGPAGRCWTADAVRLLCPAAQLLRSAGGRGRCWVRSVHAGGRTCTSWACNPIALAIMKTPRRLRRGHRRGRGPASGSAPGLRRARIWASWPPRISLMRKLPGRIVGETTDAQGRRAYVLTLQAREQHIRREKASSNICSNEALCALTAGAVSGRHGAGRAWRRLAEQSMAKAALPGRGAVRH